MDNNDSRNNDLLISFMEAKYGHAYMRAMRKLSTKDQFDSRGFLKPELMLTESEKNALLYYLPVPERMCANNASEATLEVKVESWNEIQKYLAELKQEISGASKETPVITDDQLYERFLQDVTSNTFKSIQKANPEEYSQSVKAELVGVDLSASKIISEYGPGVYVRANAEAPGTVVEGKKTMVRDFSHAKRILGHLVSEDSFGVNTSSVLDIGLLMVLLDGRGIPSYIDYENNEFHFNEKEIKL